ncbi:MAG: peptide chain release factor N(5)-glutamine methyltransferase [Nitrospira sp.]|uniref:Release factor glutamine methyltransferase n=1 Tax=Nitrospira defluvii TaxID=330214 RepID=A0ABM8QES8_9BACT|nr:peptide chain release factor N(5)-glutamine methyltransferase [Nitrospira defluvii]MCS6327644.1 peptide chain release factor N(5)-glutamine methyltransferase [Nitrospira sp.]CAE6693323.1 Release factor glutamine methyltransferase [Nitrospira defluvii]
MNGVSRGTVAAAIPTIRIVANEAERRLAAAGIDQPALEAAWLLEHAVGVSPLMQRVHADHQLTAAECEGVRTLVERRARREPLQYVLGTQEFCGRAFQVTPAVLIPRPESALLVAETVRRCANHPAATVVDVGTGSGCLAVSVALALPEARVLAIDLSAEALLVARRNMVQHGCDARIDCLQGDLLAPLGEAEWLQKIDVILSNPPYIADGEISTLQPEVGCFEPRLALAGGPDGMQVHRRLLQQAPIYLRSGGALLMEVGLGQAAAVCHVAEEGGWFRAAAVLPDEAGIARVVCFEKRESRREPLAGSR